MKIVALSTGIHPVTIHWRGEYAILLNYRAVKDKAEAVFYLHGCGMNYDCMG